MIEDHKREGKTINKLAVISGTLGQLGPLWCETLQEMGYRVEGLDLPSCDISRKEDIEARKNEIVLCEGVPQVLVLNAAVDNTPGTTANFWSDAQRIIEVNYLGNSYVVEAFLPHMLEAKKGNIVFIGSMLGFIASDYRNYEPPFDKPHAYGGSKAALWNLCKNLAVRYAKDGVICNMLALSGVEGKQYGDFKAKYAKKIPIERMLRKEDFINEFKVCVAAKVPYDYPLFVGGGYTIW